MDYVARTIVLLARYYRADGQMYNVATGHTVTYPQLAEAVEACGHPLKRLEYLAWRAMLLEQLDRTPALRPLVPFFPAQLPSLAVEVYNCQQFQAALETLGLPQLTHGPPMTLEVLTKQASVLLARHATT